MIFWILFSILLLLLLACTAIAWILYSAMMIRKDTLHYPASADPYAKERLEVQRWNADHLSGCLRIPLRGDSVTLIGYYYPLCPHSKKAVLCVHGYTSEHTERLALAELYRSLGYNILAPDCRAHGESSGIHRTMGYYDQEDVILWARYLTDVLGMEEIILDGVSMGAATVLAASGHPDLPSSVTAVIADCGYTSTHDIYAYQLKYTYHLPVFPILNIAEWFCRHCGHFSSTENAPIDRVRASHTPTLILHGAEDDFVPYFMAGQLYNACAAPKKMVTIPDAQHANSHFAHPELYQQAIRDFLTDLPHHA